MQHEMWSWFALPFVRLDSAGSQRVRQQLPSTRNPLTFFKRAIISVDTQKNEKYRAHLKRQHGDAVVIDESHNTEPREGLSLIAIGREALVPVERVAPAIGGFERQPETHASEFLDA